VRDVEIEVTFAGEVYAVTLDVEVQWEDDSFDHEFGTEECGHWEIDWDATEIISCTGQDGEEVDHEATPGLTKAIQKAAQSIDLSDWE
jgi:hypothetical protein